MFIQVIKGQVKDPSGMREVNERWQRDLRPGASGFLGSTGGVADDGTFVMVARFESEKAARANSERPEQSSWWDEASKQFDGTPTFYDCPEVDLYNAGGSDDAGFVQLMIYRPKDVDAVREVAKEFESFGSMRPDLIGSTTGYATDGTVIDTNYFTSEAEARAAEKQPMAPEVQQLVEKMQSNVGDVEFIDLRDPWLN